MALTKIKAPPGCPTSNESGALLVLLNPGRMSRHWLLGMIAGAERIGLRTEVVELGPVWDVLRSGRRSDAAGFARALREKRVRAAIGYTMNGLNEWPAATDPTGAVRPFFEQVGIPHLMWWSDHPQWASEKAALAPGIQTALRSPNHHHFLKSTLAADELSHIAGWPNCHGMPVAEDPARLRPAEGVQPEFDVVAVIGSPPALDERLVRFLDDDTPDQEAINDIVAQKVDQKLRAIWDKESPRGFSAELEAFGHSWIERRKCDPLTGSFRVFQALEPQYPRATCWLRANYRVYFDALEAMWTFGRWQRTFVLRYLSKHLKVGVFGSDWSGVGIGGGGWVEHEDQPRVYARGRVAINISQANDEEGIAHKPFQIAACRVPMVHIMRSGLEACFAPGVEVATFETPREALDTITSLLDDPNRRAAMAQAAHTRLCRDHTWDVRLVQMIEQAGINATETFGVGSDPNNNHGASPSTSPRSLVDA